MYQWKDLFGPRLNYALKGVEISPKHEGMIEQVICAAGHMFFQTEHSTFSAYITRLRGYFGSDKESPGSVFYHNRNVKHQDGPHDRQPSGHNYMREYQITWKDIDE